MMRTDRTGQLAAAFLSVSSRPLASSSSFSAVARAVAESGGMSAMGPSAAGGGGGSSFFCSEAITLVSADVSPGVAVWVACS